MDPFYKNPEFLAAFREGCPRALDRVYRFFERPLRNFILRGFAFESDGRQMYFNGLYDPSDVEDIVQETFRRAFGAKARQTFDGVRPYKNYLFTIARNAIITDVANRRRQVPVGEAIMCDSPNEDLSPLESWIVAQRALAADAAPSSHDRLENLEVYALLMGFVESLPEDERRFFETRFLGQFSQENTARRLGWNRARVRKWEARLRRSFLCHAQGTGYLEARREARVVRKVDDPAQKREIFEQSKGIWRNRRVDQYNEFLEEAA